MYTEFQNMSDQARVWIYQADRLLSKEEVEFINQSMKMFIEKWTAHGNDLFASAKVAHRHFLIVALDEDMNLASGCSIDASVHFIKELESKLKVGFFDRTKIAILRNDQVELIPLSDMGNRVLSGSVSEDDMVFNNLVPNILEMNNGWKIKVGSSWLKKYFKAKNTSV